VNGIVHDFRERLEWSQSLSDEASWMSLYRRVWPDLVVAVRVDTGQWQRWGVDRLVLLRDGREISIDEKKRDKDYGDILLETHSVWYDKDSPRNKLGWALDPTKLCDYVAYAVIPIAKCYLLPLELLQRTFRKHGKAWKERYGVRFALNKGYKTRNIPVPWPVLAEALTVEMLAAWDKPLALPIPVMNGAQLEFHW
jgi:hypothetical protein